MNSDRYYCFNNSPKCVCCGLKGEVLILELHRNQKEKNPHFNFYARQEGQLILMTKDHIMAKANGGTDARDNLQTMCTICNHLKGSQAITLDQLRKRKERFDLMEIQSLKYLSHTKFLSLYEMRYTHKEHDRNWTFVSRKQKDVIESELTGCSPVKVDAVVIVATVGHQIVVTKEFRPVIGGYEYSFPSGLVDAGESLEEAAARELKEETGLVLKDVLNISPILYSSAGCTNEAVQILHCTAEGEISAEHCEPGEDIQTFLMDKVQVERLVRATGEFEGAMIGAKTWPVLFAWF
jgi:ADP-ribose pyrophosphatase